MILLRRMLLILTLSVLLLALAAWLLRARSDAFIFFPSAKIEATPADIPLPYEDIRIRTRDNETLAGWHIPAAKPDAPTLLFFHGNAGNISHRIESIALFHELGLAVCIIDYRGYGLSTGKPSVPGTLEDARAAWDWLIVQKKLRPDQIVIFGRSLGGGPAAALAAHVQPRGLILESTFTSLRDAAKTVYPLLPAGLLPHDYDSTAAVAALRRPLLVVHSQSDEVILYNLGRALYDACPGPKEFLLIRGRHNSGFLEDRETYVNGLRAFLESLNQ